MKTTVEQVLVFNSNAALYLSMHQKKQSPFLYALTKMQTRVKNIVSEFSESTEDARVELAGKDEKGFIIVENDTYKFTPENRKKLNEKVRELKSKEVDIEPYIATSVPEDLDLTFREVFTPFVLKELSEAEAESLFSKK